MGNRESKEWGEERKVRNVGCKKAKEETTEVGFGIGVRRAGGNGKGDSVERAVDYSPDNRPQRLLL